MAIGHAVIHILVQPVELTCAGCGRSFKVHPDDERAMPGLDAGLIYCDDCNDEAHQWCECIEKGWRD